MNIPYNGKITHINDIECECGYIKYFPWGSHIMADRCLSSFQFVVFTGALGNSKDLDFGLEKGLE